MTEDKPLSCIQKRKARYVARSRKKLLIFQAVTPLEVIELLTLLLRLLLGKSGMNSMIVPGIFML
jgi:hypothetical protein